MRLQNILVDISAALHNGAFSLEQEVVMANHDLSPLHQEWAIQQQQFHHFELAANALKIVSLLSLVVLLPSIQLPSLGFLICGVIWIQEAMLKTYQQRTSDRILIVEKAISEQQSYKAMQFHTSWDALRPSATGLLKQYVYNMFKPTVMLPYFVLTTLFLVIWLIDVMK